MDTEEFQKLREQIAQAEKHSFEGVSVTLKTINALIEDKLKLEQRIDNAHMALEAVKASGSIMDQAVYEMIELGFDNKPQKPDTRLG